jgi:hypothetical protein
MSQPVVTVRPAPALSRLFAPDDDAACRFRDSSPPSSGTRTLRRAYLRAAVEFATWCEQNEVGELRGHVPIHVAAYIEIDPAKRLAAPSVKQHLAAISMLFDWLVIGQVIAANPASPVRGPKHSVKKGKTAGLRPSKLAPCSIRSTLLLMSVFEPLGYVRLRSRTQCAHKQCY